MAGITSMDVESGKFRSAMERFDAANAEDPDGEELVYAQRMSEWLEKLEPNASQALRLAARSQHIRRWEIPRKKYPMDRAGYHRWRNELAGFHAKVAGGIMREAGYDEVTVGRVQSLLRKERLKEDAEAQLLEDVICLVFLENYFADFAKEHDEAKLVGILRKTWRKMSERGHEAALKLPMGEAERKLVEKALSPGAGGESKEGERPRT
ncbi:MAG TPA: DUF4202 domain-containing protein [Tepidisphaeraceae bacterium]|nr:DUF4202 domain-containing protein [Tepidisphaeraceae bacterium]HEV8607818.1 DUF4202 domain-containing protein [Tepidisphaeraceae bacterium]